MCTYDLKYNDYFTNVSDGLRSMLATADIADVTLAVEGKFFKTHQVVLSIFSPYFRELFSANPCKHPIFFLKDVKYQVMKDLLTFMYEGKVQIAEEEFQDFVDTAKALKVKGLTNMAEPSSLTQLPVNSVSHTMARHNMEPNSHLESVTSAPIITSKHYSKRLHDTQSITHADILPLPLNENEVQVMPFTKKYKSIPQVPVPTLSEVSVLPLSVPSTSWKINSPLNQHSPSNTSITDEPVNMLEIQMKDERNCHLIEGEHNQVTFNLDNDDLQYMHEDTIELDGDEDECYVKPEGDATINLQDEEDDMMEPLGEMDAEQMIGHEGEPVVVTFVRSRKGRSISVNNYRYCMGDQSNYWTTWRCTRRRVQNQENCRAVVCLTRDYRVALKNGHNHEAPALEPNIPGALVVQQRTCRATTMRRLNSWRCHLQREKERV